jgi:hypothetical protein
MLFAASSLLLYARATSPGQIHLALTGADDSMGVSWRTDLHSSSAVVEYGVAAATATTATPVTDVRTYVVYGNTSGFYHHVEMSSLEAGATYRYRVGERGAFSGWQTFTAPAEDKPLRMVFTGDFGMGGAGPPANESLCTVSAFQQLAESDSPPDFFWVAGDLAYPNMHGKEAFEETWNEWFSILQPAFAKVPAIVSPGNHETYLPQPASTDPASGSSFTTGVVAAPAGSAERSGWHAEDGAPDQTAPGTFWNFTAFDARFRMPSARSGGARNMWYSFDRSGVHFVSIDTETDFPHASESYLNGWGGGGERVQLDWLERDLAAFRARSPAGWLVVAGHKPLYSSAPGYTKDGRPTGENAHIQAAFEPLFHKHKVDLYLAGHQHGYERSAPVFRSEVQAEGARATVYVVAAVPGGGCGITADWNVPVPQWTQAQFPDGSPWNDRHNASEEMASLGYGVLEANATAMSWSFLLSASGAVHDSYVIRRKAS